jgi:hypothetical protein
VSNGGMKKRGTSPRQPRRKRVAPRSGLDDGLQAHNVEEGCGGHESCGPLLKYRTRGR